MRYHRTLSEVAQEVSSSSSKQNYPQQYVPMFLPIAVTKEASKGAMEIQTRQKFLSVAIPMWRAYHLHKIYAIILGIVAVLTFPLNVYISAAAAALAGRYYGDYVWKWFFIHKFLKKRWLLEGT
ncbi:MAG: hypothetical protein ACP5O3_03915 [Candidatus Micrarchaeia archaeon]